MACGPTVFAKASNWGNYFYHNYFNSAIWTARGPLLERDWVCHHRLCAGGGCWLLHSVVASTHSLLQDLRCSGILHFWLSRKQLWVISGLKCSKPIISPQHNYWNRWSPPSAWSWNCIHGYTSISCAHVSSILIIWTLQDHIMLTDFHQSIVFVFSTNHIKFLIKSMVFVIMMNFRTNLLLKLGRKVSIILLTMWMWYFDVASHLLL